MGNDAILDLTIQPEEFFRELVTSALKSQKVNVNTDTEFYLVQLLNQFMSTENLYSRDQEGNFKEKPLAFMIKEALEEEEQHNQKILFRHLGDVSLYIAGFFQDSLDRKLVNIGYYVDMGGAAYSNVAALDNEPFHELSGKFRWLVDVFSEISAQTQPKSQRQILHTYEKWLNTGNGKAAQVLKVAGIIPKKDKK